MRALWKNVSPQTFLLTSIATMMAGAPAVAEIPCGGRSEIIKYMQEEEGKYLRQFGTANGSMVEVYVSEDGKFTIIATMPNSPGNACLVAMGEGWETVKRSAKLRDQPI